MIICSNAIWNDQQIVKHGVANVQLKHKDAKMKNKHHAHSFQIQTNPIPCWSWRVDIWAKQFMFVCAHRCTYLKDNYLLHLTGSLSLSQVYKKYRVKRHLFLGKCILGLLLRVISIFSTLITHNVKYLP